MSKYHGGREEGRRGGGLDGTMVEKTKWVGERWERICVGETICHNIWHSIRQESIFDTK